jgi:hypothetical protein
MTDTNTRSYIDGTHLFLGVEAILSEEEKDRFLTNVCETNPGLQGAHVADVLDMFDNYDMHLEVTEPQYEEHAEEIVAYGIPRLFTLCCYLALYLHPDDDDEARWEHTKEFIARWEAKRCGHVWYEGPQEGEEPTDPRGYVARTCTLDKDHTFPVDHHDRRAPNF